MNMVCFRILSWSLLLTMPLSVETLPPMEFWLVSIAYPLFFPLHSFHFCYFYQFQHSPILNLLQALLYSHFELVLGDADWLAARLKTSLASDPMEDILGTVLFVGLV